ncbi:MAG: hypothetical protein WBP45_13680 [Daejeonella sp.]
MENNSFDNKTDSLPILTIKPSQGEKALIDHILTAKEQSIFSEMDSAVSKLPQKQIPEEDLQQAYKAIIPIGKKYGLTEKQCIAFWTRTTFSLFEEQ